ncbi:MAG: VCBS repeat-containing protein [Myxococcota bacterium]
MSPPAKPDQPPRPAAAPSRRRRLAACAGLLTALSLATAAHAAPKPRSDSGGYDRAILGFNDGTPYRLHDAAAAAVIGDATAVVYRFTKTDWMSKDTAGAYVSAREMAGRFPQRSPSDLFDVFSVDLDADRVPEIVLIPRTELLGDGRRYAPTILGLSSRGGGGYTPLWSAQGLPGERSRVVDIRDLNVDGRPELLIAGEAGTSGYYQFHELVARGPEGFRTLPVRHVDSVHYVDLDRDGRVELVVRERVGRRGPAYQWTYVDQLRQWDGKTFADATARYPRYHDEETLPTLVSDLIDHYDAKTPILDEKIEAIRSVRATVLATVPRPSDLDRQLVVAVGLLQKEQILSAKKALLEVNRAYPYETQVLVGLAQVHAALEEWPAALEAAIRALTVSPRDRRAWWWAGVAFSQVEERSSAVASFTNLVKLCGAREEGLAFLRARRGEPGMEESLQRAIDQTLRALGVLPSP